MRRSPAASQEEPERAPCAYRPFTKGGQHQRSSGRNRKQRSSAAHRPHVRRLGEPPVAGETTFGERVQARECLSLACLSLLLGSCGLPRVTVKCAVVKPSAASRRSASTQPMSGAELNEGRLRARQREGDRSPPGRFSKRCVRSVSVLRNLGSPDSAGWRKAMTSCSSTTSTSRASTR